jgi:hypothetical protein
MIVTLLLLLILAATVAALPARERPAGLITALAALMTAGVLAVSEAGFCLTPNGWLFAVALVVALLNYLLGFAETETKKHRWELR